MSELQKAWARGRLGPPGGEFPFPDETLEAEEETDLLSKLPEHATDDDSSSASSASSASSTGTIVPSPSQNTFARPIGYVAPYSSHEGRWLYFFFLPFN